MHAITRRMLIVIGVASFALLMAACSSTDVLGPEDNGSTVDISEGEVLEIQLAGNPTTGFNWQVTDTLDQSVLTQDGDPEFDAEDESLGSPGVVTLKFKAVGTGTTPLDLEYKAVSGDAPADRTYSLTVNVS